jgi:putative endonuclease
MSAEHLETGIWGEKQAEKFLRKKKYRIVGRRVRVGSYDEFDLIARDGRSLVFVEVKTKSSEDFGRPMVAVDSKKRHVLSRGAVRYLKKLRKKPDFFRFDVVEVVGKVGDKEPLIRHIENAFTLDKCYSVPY